MHWGRIRTLLDAQHRSTLYWRVMKRAAALALLTLSLGWPSGATADVPPYEAPATEPAAPPPPPPSASSGGLRRPVVFGLLAAAFLIICGAAGANDRIHGDKPKPSP